MKKNLLSFVQSHLFVFSMLLIMKAIVVHAILFKDYNIFKTFIVEGSYIVIFLGLIEWISRKGKPYIYLFANLLISTLFTAIMMYVTWFNTIPTYYSLVELGQVGAIRDSVSSLLDPLYILLYFDIIVFCILLILKRYPFSPTVKSHKWTTRVVIASLFVAILAFSHYKNINIANPVLAADTKGIFNFEALNIYQDPQKGVDNTKVTNEQKPYQLNKKIANLKDVKLMSEKERNYFGFAKGKNVIVIQMESFQNFLINLKVDGEEVTPNLNKLASQSFYFPNVFQQVGPGNTADAEFIMSTSLFPNAYTPTSLTSGKKNFPSFPKLLNTNGYNTMTFHTDKITFWNRDELYPSLGFSKFYDKSYFGDEDTVGMASSDDVLYSKGIEALKQAKKPFYSMFITLSSHHPFVIPDDKKSIQLPPKYDGTLIGNYLEAQNYTDAAIGRFIQQLKDNGLWNNTVLLFYGDHLGLQENALSEQDQELMEPLLGHKYSIIDRYTIPFIITVPGKTDNGKVIKTVGGQLDFMPTLANLLGIPIDHKLVHFGEDLLDYKNNLIGMRYYLPFGSFINNQVIYYPNEGFTDGDAISLATKKRVTNFSKFESDYDHMLELEKLSDAYVNQIPDRIIKK